MKPTTCHLSDMLIVARGCSDMIDILSTQDWNVYGDSIVNYTRQMADAINTIMEHSSPLEWSDEEYDWIEQITQELNQGANDEF